MTKPKGRKNSKIRKLIEKQTAEQRSSFDGQIQSLMQNELAKTIEVYTNRYGPAIERRLGKTTDDIENEIREKVWKGLLSFKKTGKANLTTYLNNIIGNYFYDALDQVNSTKYSSVGYYADPHEASGANPDDFSTTETGEELYERREEFMRNLRGLTLIEQKICVDLALGYDLQEMTKRHDLTVPQLVSAINKIDTFIKARRKECA